MRVRAVRQLLWTWGGTCLVASAGVVIWTYKDLSAARVETSQVAKNKQDRVIRTAARAPLDLVRLRTAADLDLRRPLFDPPPPAPVAAPPPPSPPPLTVKLAGTVIERGQSRAMLVNSQGKLEFKRVGEKSDEAEVLDIQTNQVTVRYHGEPVVLKLERKGDGG